MSSIHLRSVHVKPTAAHSGDALSNLLRVAGSFRLVAAELGGTPTAIHHQINYKSDLRAAALPSPARPCALSWAGGPLFAVLRAGLATLAKWRPCAGSASGCLRSPL
jgi:hypothetical protein